MIDHDIGSQPGVWGGTPLKASIVGTAPPPECGHAPPHADTSPRALQANPFAERWLLVVSLLIDPPAASRRLIDRLSAWPAEVRQHECADEPEPRRGPLAVVLDKKHRTLSPLTFHNHAEISQTETPAKGG